MGAFVESRSAHLSLKVTTKLLVSDCLCQVPLCGNGTRQGRHTYPTFGGWRTSAFCEQRWSLVLTLRGVSNRHLLSVPGGRVPAAVPALVVVLGVSLVMGACTAPGQAASQAAEPATTLTPGKSSGTTTNDPVFLTTPATPTTTPSPKPQPFTMAFGGDVHFEGRARALLDAPDQWATMRSIFDAADFAMVNLETAITERGTPLDKKYTFRAPARSLTALKAAGVDAVSLANNHGADFGSVGLADTLAAKASNELPMLGIGANAKEAYAPHTVTLGGTSVGILASSQLFDATATHHSATDSKPGIAVSGDPKRMVQAIKDTAANHDIVVVFQHWGTERMLCPDARQRRNAALFAEAGADVIVGAHAHIPQGSGWMGNTYVAYGLGNFVWYHSRGVGGYSGIMTLTIDPTLIGTDEPAVVSETWTPLFINSRGIPDNPSSGMASTMTSSRSKANACTGLTGRTS